MLRRLFAVLAFTAAIATAAIAAPLVSSGDAGAFPFNAPLRHGGALFGELRIIHALFVDHDKITRTVSDLPDGIRTTTESDDPQIAQLLKEHVASMIQRVNEGRDPELPIESNALHGIFRDGGKIRTHVAITANGVVVTQTSSDPQAVAELQRHASQVSDFVREGMVALRDAMMKGAPHAMTADGSMHGGRVPMAGMMRMMMNGPAGGETPRGAGMPMRGFGPVNGRE